MIQFMNGPLNSSITYLGKIIVTIYYIASMSISVFLQLILLRCRSRPKILNKVTTFLLVIAILIYVSTICTYLYVHEYIESRGDAKYFIMTSLKTLHGLNPYTPPYPCAYGPTFLIVISPLYFLPTGFRIVVYGLLIHLTLIYIFYRIVIMYMHRQEFKKYYVATALVLSLAINPHIHYSGISLAQLDDLMLAVFIALFIYLISMKRFYLASLVASIMIGIKLYMMLVLAPLYALLINMIEKRKYLKMITITVLLILAPYVLAIMVFDDYFIENAIQIHLYRIGGFSLANSVVYLLGDNVRILVSTSMKLLLILSILILCIYLALTNKRSASVFEFYTKIPITLLIATSTYFLLTPFLYATYLIIQLLIIQICNVILILKALEREDNTYVRSFIIHSVSILYALTIIARLYDMFHEVKTTIVLLSFVHVVIQILTITICIRLLAWDKLYQRN